MADPTSPGDLQEKSILTEAELEEIAPRSRDSRLHLLTKIRSRFRCSGTIVKSLLLKFIPILNWLPRYPVKEWLLGDMISGLSVGIIQLPQGLAYALLAGVPPVFGLYSSFYPVVIYTIFGTSRHISPGTFAVISVMVGSVTESLAPSDNYMMPGNDSMILDTVARDADRVQVASALTLLVGIFQILFGLVQVGFVVTYLSEPLVRGYTSAAAIHVTLSQLKSILGVEISQRSHPLSLIYTFINLCSKIPQTNLASLFCGVLAIVLMLTVKFLNEKYYSKIRIPIPIELITLIVATGISYGVNLNRAYDVAIVGHIPTGLQAPIVPRTDLFASVVGNAFAIAVVVYAFTISLVKMFAVKHGYNVDSNQELIALGLSNSFGSFFQCFTIGTAMSRSLVQESTGGNSQVAGAVSALVILIIILKAGELFESLPKAILASVVVVNLKGIYKQFMDIPALWRSNKIDLMVWLVTFTATILLNLDLGLAVSIAFSLLTVIFRTQWPHYSMLGQVSSTDIYRDMSQYKQAFQIPGIKIFRSSCTLYFANAELYANAVKKMCGIDVDKLIELKKKEAKKKQQLKEKAEKEEKKGLKKQKKKSEIAQEKELEYIHSHNIVVRESQIEVLGNEVLEETTLNSVEPNKCPFHSLILDLSTVSFVDTVSIKILKNIFRDFQEIDVTVYLVGCHENVLEQLECGNFFSKTITKHQLFFSIHDAVTYILRIHRNKLVEEENSWSTKI
ncbi:solute carrier family 26 member 6-like isoform X1 [Hyla sarda]|uniref:solute carrier family 26 member 6-like isoform X1 n=2 Tax=Hyla sarda TaxID=327740 RepID=UPI0024C27177|nr:solute carrier family 26 member 6-like isoform X1 [Hyla sarda]XP_056380778.1 solute carrier family 26 member 6-like isoform X1 [Hyla sarda]XP_056380779.1 solute carrier family 26 member 6-like isoform X1 [Hyla sarda]XP_056380780.1 solute carrier family 26 member 6-like isoform X1 [Hyla sarda]